jgi:IS30 family transposase
MLGGCHQLPWSPFRGGIYHSPNVKRLPCCELNSAAFARSPGSWSARHQRSLANCVVTRQPVALSACLRTGRALRVPRARARQRGKQFITPEVMISQRPPEVADRAVPGHWEGDLIIGLNSSAIGTLVERTTRFTMLLHLPPMVGHAPGARVKNGPALAGHGAEAVRDAISAKIATLPEQLGKSLTWDQGAEMAQHAQLRLETGLEIYFCDPRSPWQRGTNENTNGLLRQYFPKGTDMSRYGERELDAVAATLNGRPRKTLGWKTPAEALNALLSEAQQTGVATTP